MKFTSLLLLIPCIGQAAPHPATSTSVLTAPEKGLYLVHKGFSLSTQGSKWVPVGDSESILGSVKFASKEAPEKGSLSVRTDKLAKNADLDLYAKKWMRDYPNYGFEVLASKNINLNGNPALLVDMISRSKNKQIRQVIFKRNNEVAIMTCLDDRETFSAALVDCNQIIKSFTWK